MEDIELNGVLALSKPIVHLFWSCAEQDSNLQNRLDTSLSPLKLSGDILTWHKGESLPGTIWEKEAREHLNDADLFVPVLSADFFSSHHCWKVEMACALKRWEQGEMAITPVLGNSVDYKETPISSFSILPANAKAITDWENHEQAYADVAVGIRKVVKILLARKWKQHGDTHVGLEEYEQALMAYDEALILEPQNASLYNDKGEALFYLNHFENAIAMYNKAIELDPKFGLAYQGKGRALEAFAPLARKKYQQLAKQAYEKANALEKNKKDTKRGHR